MNQAGVYISVPFCRQKCTYCNFASDVHPSSLLPRYLDSLCGEISHHSALWSQSGIPARHDPSINTIYMGGGTPGMLNSGQLGRLLESVHGSFHVQEGAEITIEASPENVTSEAAANWVANGINRVSMGVQSLVREELRAVGRVHDRETVAHAFANLRTAGIHNISVDLIAGLPNQTRQGWEHSVQSLLQFAPSHFSVYMLEVDDDSRLGREIMQSGTRYQAGAIPSEDEVAEFYTMAMALLRDAGFEHYEISNFALPGKSSRHNQKYWANVPYFGFGVEAHSYDGERRWANADSVAGYLERMERDDSAIIEQRTLLANERLEERFFLGLRRREGVSLSQVAAEFSQQDIAGPMQDGLNLRERYAAPIREFCQAGWLESDGDRLRLTDQGVLFSNEVFAGFLEGD